MSLMSKIGRGLLAKPKPETQLRVAIEQRNAELNPPPATKPPPRAKSAATRQRMSDSQKLRYANSDPAVPTSARPTPPTGEQFDAANDRAAEIFLKAARFGSPAMAKQLTRLITPPKPTASPAIAAPPPAPLITPPPLPPVPPRPELDLVKSLEALPLPPPAAVPPAPVLTGRGSCKARNPATGIQCALLAGHTKLHRHGSTEFRFGAAPGESRFPRRDALEDAATHRDASPFTTT